MDLSEEDCVSAGWTGMGETHYAENTQWLVEVTLLRVQK